MPFAPALFAGAMLLPPVPAVAQSFDCRAARSPDELTICQDPGLARLDQQLATLYHRDASNLEPEQRDAFQRHEIYFINARRRCGENPRCIEASYRNRIGELAAMLATPATERSSEAKNPNDGRLARHPDRHDKASDDPAKERSGSSGPASGDDERSARHPDRHDKASDDPAKERSGSSGPANGDDERAARQHDWQGKANDNRVEERWGSTDDPATGEAAVTGPMKATKPSHSKHQTSKSETTAVAAGAATEAAPNPPAAHPAAPAPAATAPTKPTIHWTDPPPAR
jgi:uncharacterized protein